MLIDHFYTAQLTAYKTCYLDAVWWLKHDLETYSRRKRQAKAYLHQARLYRSLRGSGLTQLQALRLCASSKELKA